VQKCSPSAHHRSYVHAGFLLPRRKPRSGRAVSGISVHRERDQRSITEQSIPTASVRQALRFPAPRLIRGVTAGTAAQAMSGDRVIGQWQADMPGPPRGTKRRTALGGERRPQSEVLEDAPDDSRILDQGNDPHRPLALGALQRIGFQSSFMQMGDNPFASLSSRRPQRRAGGKGCPPSPANPSCGFRAGMTL
jgi:hypothetical protein